jgi:outer membrane protein OmpA-like peptidoglycan-associated protein
MVRAFAVDGARKPPTQPSTIALQRPVARRAVGTTHQRRAVEETDGLAPQPRFGRDFSTIPIHGDQPTAFGPPSVVSSSRHVAAAAPLILRRECACGGACPECRARRDGTGTSVGDGGPVASTLLVGRHDDPLEVEAQRIADRVVTTSAADLAVSTSPRLLSRTCASCKPDELYRAAARPAALDGNPAPRSVHRVLAQPGRPLDAASRRFFEPRLDTHLGHVRLHDDAQASSSARDVGAHAYTVGRHIVFDTAPDVASDRGRRLIAHELAHVLQQTAPAARRNSGPAATLRRTCGPAAIGQQPECARRAPQWVAGPAFKFVVDCDDFSSGEQERLVVLVTSVDPRATFEIHGYASTTGDPGFNDQLACARALRASAALTGSAGIAASRVTGIVSHGETPGPAAERQSVVVAVTTPAAVVRHQFRASAWSFLSCAPCNPYTDDGTLGLAPPTTEPTSSTFRQRHFVELEVATTDARHLDPATAGVTSFGHVVGHSGYCGTVTAAHVLSATGPGSGTRITSPVHGEGIEVRSAFSTQVGAVVPATLPGAPCGFLGTNPLIPPIHNTFVARLFADGTKQSGFVTASAFPFHFLYEDGTLLRRGGAPVNPGVDFPTWATSTGVPVAASIVGFKALRVACCRPTIAGAACDTLCVGGISVPSPAFSAVACAVFGATLAAGGCPSACTPAGGACTAPTLPANP